MRTIWKGSVVLGLVSVPVRLQAAISADEVHFHMLHKECHSRTRQQIFCPVCQRTIDRKETEKGYEYEEDKYVVVDEKELEKLEAERSRTIEIIQFVQIQQVDPIYYDRPYYLTPDEVGEKAYQLLTKAMKEAGRVALGKFVLKSQEHLVLIRPADDGLMLHFMRYEHELRKLTDYWKPGKMEVREKELRLAEQLVESLTEDFSPEKYKDEYRESLLGLIQAKIEGRSVAVVEPKREMGQVVNLMDALKKSLEGAAKGVKRPAARVAAAAERAASPVAGSRKRRAKH
ncbi:MAG: Ku protein [Acidobacteria bacterium]|nr:Ku protein [Acidobacteriota bacterium]